MAFEEDPFARRVEVREVDGSVEAVASRPSLLSRGFGELRGLGLAALVMLFAIVFGYLFGSQAITGNDCPLGWTCSGDPMPRWGAAIVLLVALAAIAGCIVYLYAMLARGGNEFVRVDPRGVTHGWRWAGRDRFVTTHPYVEVDEIALGPNALEGRKLGRATTGFFPHAAQRDLETAAARLSAAIRKPTLEEPATLPRDVRLQELQDGGILTLTRVRWGRIAAAYLVFWSPFALAVYLAMEAFATDGDTFGLGLALLLAAVFFAIISAMALRVGPLPSRVEVRPGEVVVAHGPIVRRSRFERRPSVEWTDGNLFLVEGTRRLQLAFERLDVDERPLVVPVVERLVAKAWPQVPLQRGT